LPPELLLLAQICTESFVGRGFATDPTGGAYSAPPDSRATLGVPPGEGEGERGEGKEEEGRGKEGRKGKGEEGMRGKAGHPGFSDGLRKVQCTG